ncbi:type I polyketide synthase [Flavobacterium sp. LC2016-13]|uniref:type I polyketide synthase n=1 Tax=Flavobacterium sp. LC2016-13 TaxID=2675875 RepID=UPI0012B8796A|nr:type I polyketide synthase [Flavobacterium sp. LC2016-13]MTD72405.1 AMP-binding protein [Flavobacterium sp. LC2016-13]
MEKEQLTEKLKQSLGVIKKLKNEVQKLKENDGPIAVIGMACKLPGKVNNTEDFWQLLLDKKNGIVDIPADRWNIDDFYDENLSVPGKMCVRKGGFIDDIDLFDAQFFGISPIEAEALDPQQRILLQTTLQAIESAGIPTEKLKGSLSSVFIGIASPEYIQQRAATKQYHLMDVYDVTGNTPCTAAGRISYNFDLKGSNLALDTACSSSLAAIHLACNSLHNGESDLAIAGGVNLMLEPNAHIIFSKMGALSPEGECRSFDANANGFVRSEGCGVVLLKRLKDAERDGDNILAVIKGSALNQDGKSNGLIAPNGLAQQEVLKSALLKANMTPSEIDYIETHGTGTPLGDPIEIEAINRVYGKDRINKNTLHIGSVKTNVGHLESASGITSFIKAVLSLKNRCIPANLNFKTPSPHIEWMDFVKVPIETTKYNIVDKPMAVGVSAFGFSGTNAHVILEEYKTKTNNSEDSLKNHIVFLSAKTDKSLLDIATRYKIFLKTNSQISLSDFSYTTGIGRSHFAKRLAIITSSTSDCLVQLDQLQNPKNESIVISGLFPESTKLITSFLYNGQGTQYPGMGKELYHSQPVFKAAVDECIEYIDKEIEFSFLDLLLGENIKQDLNQTEWAQPAIFIIEYALTKLWEYWGIKPNYILGHSIGEYAAACYSGIFSLQDALKLITARGKLMEGLKNPGKMISIVANEEKARIIIDRFEQVSIAAINGDESVVLSGDAKQIDEIISIHGEQIKMKPLNVSHAFHSPLMKPMLEEFSKLCKTITYNNTSTIQIISSVTGKIITNEMSTSDYWVDHVIKTVKFKKGLEMLVSLGANVFLEIGADAVLSGLSKTKVDQKSSLVITSLKKNRNNNESILFALAQLYVNGANVFWQNFYQHTKNSKISIPTYPFQTKRYWLENNIDKEIGIHNKPNEHPLLGSKRKLAGSINTYIWEQQFNLRSISYLCDHKIENTIIFPAACYTEMAVSAVKELSSQKHIELNSIKFEKVFILKDEEIYELQMQVKKEDNNFHFSIYSRTLRKEKDSEWVFRMSGMAITKEDTKQSVTLDIDAIKKRSLRQLSGAAFYADWYKSGNHWENTFKGVSEIWIGKDEILSFSKTPVDIVGQMKDYHSHPALMDICGQLLAAGIEGTKESAFVGKGIGAVKIHDHLSGDAFWSYAKILNNDTINRKLIGDVQVFNSAVELVAETTNVEFEFIGSQSNEIKIEQWIHEVEWIDMDIISEAIEQKDSWLIFDRAKTLGAKLFSSVNQHGLNAIVIEEVERLKTCIENNQKIIYIPQNIIGESSDYLNEIYLIIQEIEIIIKTITDYNGEAIKLWVITRGAWSYSAEEKLLHATLWGFVKSLELENEKIWGGIIDIENSNSEKFNFEQILSLICREQKEKQILIGENSIQVPRLRKAKITPPSNELKFRKDATYMITGGLGDLGLLTAEWMIKMGARRLILTSRNGLPSRNKWKDIDSLSKIGNKINAVKKLELNGAHIEILKLDVADEKKISTWYDEYCSASFPPIKGVIHAAGNVSYTPFGESNAQKAIEQLSPKILGVINLDKILNDNLDFFIMYSSASAILASPGLNIYAAANSFMDALALSRTNRGLKTLSINWGAWSDTGLVNEALKNQKSSYKIMNLISPSQGMSALELVWNSSLGRLAVLPVDWSSWTTLFPSSANMPFFNEVIEFINPIRDDNSEWVDFLNEFNGNQEATVLEIEKYLIQKISVLLRLDKGDISTHISLAEYGLDSMMAIELKNKIETNLKVILSMVDLIQGPSINELAMIIAERLNNKIETIAIEHKHQELSAGINYKLSAGQESLWTLYQMNPSSSAYNVAFTTRIMNGLNLDKWKEAIEIIVNRHETLRISFSTSETGIHQTLRPLGQKKSFSFNIIDACNWDNEKLYEEVKSAYEIPFNLENDPLLRVDMFDEGKGSFVMLLTLHHMCCDGWSLWVLLDELKEVYSSLCTNKEIILTEKIFNYFDFVSWQDEMLVSNEGTRLWQFWKKQLEGELPVLNLPVDYPRSLTTENVGATYRFDIDKDLVEKLKEFSKKESATLFMSALTLFKILLYRYTNTEDIIIGSPTSGRSKMEFAGLVGDFINMTVVRTKPSNILSFREYLGKVKQTVLDVLSNQDFPFPLIVKKLNPKREAGQTPIFQSMFSLQKPQKFEEIIALMEGDNVKWGELELSPFNMPQQEGQFDITLELIENSKGIAGIFKYNYKLFNESTIVRMQEQYVNLMRALLDNPDQLISTVSMHNKVTEDTILKKWIGNNVKLSEKGINTLIEEQVARNATTTALVDGDEELSYSELDCRANQFAAYLISKGVKKGELVGICTERSFNMVICILAVLKSGAAYVPLDPDFPVERLNFITSDSNISYLITENNHFKLFGEFNGVVIDLDQEARNIAKQPYEQNSITVYSDDLAYVIYTSGSTGRPKGTLITHGNVVNFCKGMNTSLGSDPGTLLAVTTISFDIAVLELIWTLTNGFKVVLQENNIKNLATPSMDSLTSLNELENSNPLPEAGTIKIYSVVENIIKNKVSHLQCTPSLMRILINDDNTRNELKWLKKIMLGGEKLPLELIKKINAVSEAEIFNMYGPTETTVWSSVKKIDKQATRITLGSPIDNTQFYILDSFLNPVSEGMLGELYIGGKGVTAGYINRPALTEEKFIKNPFSDEYNLIYRTGDLVRYDSNNEIEYIERADLQVKVNGHRIEIEEIEIILNQMPLVEQGVVVCVKKDENDALVACIVVSEGEQLDIKTLRSQLKMVLPAYMIPGFFHIIPEIPLTANGKINRSVLQNLDIEISSQNEYVAPRNDLEEKLVNIWKELLNVQRVGIYDDFFELGGHSLLAVKLISEIRKIIEVDIEMRLLFELTNIALISEYIEMTKLNLLDTSKVYHKIEL